MTTPDPRSQQVTPWDRHQVYAVIPFNRNGAILGILRIAFKAFFEYVREETFGKFGLQQIQADCVSKMPRIAVICR